EVRDVFRSPKFGAVAGFMVIDGTVYRNRPIRVLREDVVIYEGELEFLRRFKDDVGEVRIGVECGIGVESYNAGRIGDRIVVIDEGGLGSGRRVKGRVGGVRAGMECGSGGKT